MNGEDMDALDREIESDIRRAGRRFCFALVLAGAVFSALILAGCGTLSGIVPPAPKSPAQAVYEAKASLTALEQEVGAGLGAACPAASSCPLPVLQALYNAATTAQTLVNSAEQAVALTPNDATTLQKAAADASAAIQAFAAIATQYGLIKPATATATPPVSASPAAAPSASNSGAP